MPVRLKALRILPCWWEIEGGPMCDKNITKTHHHNKTGWRAHIISRYVVTQPAESRHLNADGRASDAKEVNINDAEQLLLARAHLREMDIAKVNQLSSISIFRLRRRMSELHTHAGGR